MWVNKRGDSPSQTNDLSSLTFPRAPTILVKIYHWPMAALSPGSHSQRGWLGFLAAPAAAGAAVTFARIVAMNNIDVKVLVQDSSGVVRYVGRAEAELVMSKSLIVFVVVAMPVGLMVAKNAATSMAA